jgi:hypothetical protein
MKNNFITFALVPLTLAALVLAGCSKTSTAPAALAPEQIPATMNQVFQQTSGATKELVNQCVAASQNQQPTAAFTHLQQLSRQGDLTVEQRATAARAMVATIKQLRAASDQGDPAAKAAMNHYLSTR